MTLLNSKIWPAVYRVVEQIRDLESESDKRFFCLFCQEIFSDSDRAAVVVGAAYLDGLLQSAIRERVGEPEVAKRSARSFSERGDLALYLKVIHKDVHDWLNDLRLLRNRMAHEVLPGFDLNDPSIADSVGRLTRPGRPSPTYYEIAAACGRSGLSAAQINFRARVVAYCEMIRRAIQDPHRMPVRWIQPPTDGSIS